MDLYCFSYLLILLPYSSPYLILDEAVPRWKELQLTINHLDYETDIHLNQDIHAGNFIFFLYVFLLFVYQNSKI